MFVKQGRYERLPIPRKWPLGVRMWEGTQLAPTFADSLLKSMRVRFKPQSYTPLPPGTYNVRLTDINEGWGAYCQAIYVFKFEVIDGQYASAVVNGLINKNATGHSLKCKLWKWVWALSGAEVDADDEFDLMILVGKECMAVIKRAGHINNIAELLPKNKAGGQI
jgi:hypothetical protein